MILASHQPNFFPYMGYFYKIAKCDLFVFSDDVKFSNSKTGDMHNYNFIKGPHGKQRITLPVQYHEGDLVKDVRIFNDEKQIKKMLTGIVQYYGKAPYFNEVYPVIDKLFSNGYDKLTEFNTAAIRLISAYFGIKTKFEWSPGFKTAKSARIIDMCKYFGATRYLCGSAAADSYIDSELFCKKDVMLIRSRYTPPVYTQRYGDFIPNLSVLDWLFNMGYTLPEGWLK